MSRPRLLGSGCTFINQGIKLLVPWHHFFFFLFTFFQLSSFIYIIIGKDVRVCVSQDVYAITSLQSTDTRYSHQSMSFLPVGENLNINLKHFIFINNPNHTRQITQVNRMEKISIFCLEVI